MIEDPLSSAQLGIAPEEFIDQEPLSVTPSVVPPLEINTPPLEPGDEIPLPTSAELNLVPNSIFSRSYDAMNQLAQTGQPITPRSVALIALANEIAAGLSISDAEFKVSNNIYAQRKSFFKNHGIEIETYKSEEHGLAFKPQKTTEPKTFRTPKSEANKNTEPTPDLQKEPIKPRLSAFEIDIYSHPERFGEEGSDVRRTAEILFSRALANRGSSRELILEDFAPGYLLDHPGASQKTISNAFGRSIVLLEQALKDRDSSFRIPRSTGNSKNSILKIEHDSIPLPITTQEEAKQISVDKETETEGKEQETIDTSVFGVSKTTLIQYLLSSNKARTLTDISVIRRKDGKTGPVLTAEMNTTRMVVSTLQLELPKGVELRNSLDQNNKPLPDQFEVYPKDITIQQIIELKKQEIEASRIAKESEQKKQEAERISLEERRVALEAERLAQKERMRIEAEKAQKERLEAERIVAEERALEESLAKALELEVDAALRVLEVTKPDAPVPQPAERPDPIQKAPQVRRFEMRPGVQEEVSAKRIEPQKEAGIEILDGKVVLSDDHLKVFDALKGMGQNGAKPRDIAQIITQGKAKGIIIPDTERRLKELMDAFSQTPIRIIHPTDENGIVDDRRFILDIPEGVNPLNFISFRS